MAVRVAKILGQDRNIPIGYGVSFTFRCFGFADYKKAQAKANRIALTRVSEIRKIAMDVMDGAGIDPEFQDEVAGLAAEIHLDSLVLEFMTGWEGVLGEEPEDPQDDDPPLPFTVANWEFFRNHYPLLVDILDRKLREPLLLVEQEGNV